MKRAILLTLTTGLLLTGCDGFSPQKTEATAPANQKTPEELEKEARIKLLNDISGVWTDQGGLVTIHYNNDNLQLIFGDNPIVAQVGDIDPENNTVNILVTKKNDGEEGIITVAKKMNPEGTAFKLLVNFFDGTTHSLSFVRKIGTDDKNRINRIYRKAQEESDALAKQQAEALAIQQALEAGLSNETEYSDAEYDDAELVDYDTEDDLSDTTEHSELTYNETV